jgi:hypothetical protein
VHLIGASEHCTQRKQRNSALGYVPDWIIARLGVMEFLASGMGDTALQNDQTYLRGIQHIDAGPRNQASFVLCDQLNVA